MIQVTFNFTSLVEAANALLTLSGIGKTGVATVSSVGPTPEIKIDSPAPAPGKPKAEKAAPAPAPTTAPAAATPPTAPAAAAPSPAPSPTTTPAPAPAADAVDYPTLQRAVFELGSAVKAAGLDVSTEILPIARRFGFDTFKSMSADPAGAQHYGAALAAVRERLASVNKSEPALA